VFWTLVRMHLEREQAGRGPRQRQTARPPAGSRNEGAKEGPTCSAVCPQFCHLALRMTALCCASAWVVASGWAFMWAIEGY
jgi:hypothetical protein